MNKYIPYIVSGILVLVCLLAFNSYYREKVVEVADICIEEHGKVVAGYESNKTVCEECLCGVENPTPFEQDMIDQVEYVASVYKYREDIQPTEYILLSEIAEKGGTCKDYARWHVKLAQDKGYKAQIMDTWVGLERHWYTEVTSSGRAGDAYCIIDQNTLVGCMELL